MGPDISKGRWQLLHKPCRYHDDLETSSCVPMPQASMLLMFKENASLKRHKAVNILPSVTLGFKFRSNEAVCNKDTIRALREEGILSGPQLPATVGDAMERCLQLDKKSFWVDLLCILPDSSEDQQIQIRATENIFASTSLVIIGACCQGAESQLVDLRSRLLKRQKKIRDLVFINYLKDSCRHYTHSNWATRSWLDLPRGSFGWAQNDLYIRISKTRGR